MTANRLARAGLLALLAFPWAGCGDRTPAGARGGAPNVIVVLWDTVRADRLGPYGYRRPTTPFLDVWSREARVFENAVSPAPYTVAAHGSIFTGLLPSEHGASNAHPFLDDRRTTLAEILRKAGYQTYLFSANPHISRVENFHRGFDAVEHPWDPANRDEAFRIVAAKITADDVSTELAEKIRAGRPRGGWDIKAAGELANRGVTRWLTRRDRSRPYFAFLNYMEAHRPWIPPASFRRRTMTEEQLARSYAIDRSWEPIWSYSFGLRDYSPDELEVMSATYDACIAELDELFRDLVGSLRAAGELENTVVILTSDHGEHLGEHHLLDHQYSLHEPLLRVPLVVRDPARFPAGREPRPVMTHDLFPTVLELAGVPVPEGTRAVSLRTPLEGRVRLSEYVGVFTDAFAAIDPRHPGWDKAPWLREIRALYRDDRKLIRWSDGEKRLYDLSADPSETRDLAPDDDSSARALETALAVLADGLERGPSGPAAPGEIPEEHRELLRSLGYVHGGTERSPRP